MVHNPIVGCLGGVCVTSSHVIDFKAKLNPRIRHYS